MGSNSDDFGIDTNKVLYLRYGQNLPIAAIIVSHSYSQISLGNLKQSNASNNVMVSIVFSDGIFANFLSSSSADQI
jgi:hypothetical protein